MLIGCVKADMGETMRGGRHEVGEKHTRNLEKPIPVTLTNHLIATEQMTTHNANMFEKKCQPSSRRSPKLKLGSRQPGARERADAFDISTSSAQPTVTEKTIVVI